MRESEIEGLLVREVNAVGGLIRKVSFPGRRGAPDRLVALRGKLFLVETKAPKGRVSPLQSREHRVFAAQGIPVTLVYTIDQVQKFISFIVQET